MTRHSLYELLMVVSGICSWFASFLISHLTSEFHWILIGFVCLVTLIGAACHLHRRNDQRTDTHHRHF